jgi:hypothetical protein
MVIKRNELDRVPPVSALEYFRHSQKQHAAMLSSDLNPARSRGPSGAFSTFQHHFRSLAPSGLDRRCATLPSNNSGKVTHRLIRLMGSGERRITHLFAGALSVGLADKAPPHQAGKTAAVTVVRSANRRVGRRGWACELPLEPLPIEQVLARG